MLHELGCRKLFELQDRKKQLVFMEPKKQMTYLNFIQINAYLILLQAAATKEDIHLQL